MQAAGTIRVGENPGIVMVNAGNFLYLLLG